MYLIIVLFGYMSRSGIAGSHGNCIFIFLGTTILSSIVTAPIYILTNSIGGFQGGASGEEPACQCRDIRDTSSVPVSGRSPGGRHSNPLQYSCLENPMDRGPWQAIVQRVTKSRT